MTNQHFTVFDTETTGLDPRTGARVLELAVVRIDADGNEIEAWSTLVHPGDGVELGATDIHGITADMVVGAPRFADVVGNFVTTARGSILMAHNAPFDLSMLRNEFKLAGLLWPEHPVGDTLVAARKLMPGLPSYKLTALAEHLGIVFTGEAHTALADTRVAARLATHLLGLTPNKVWPDTTSVAWPVAIAGDLMSRAVPVSLR
jgi:DNA polymerase-3 subunit epsilon